MQYEYQEDWNGIQLNLEAKLESKFPELRLEFLQSILNS